MVYGKSEWEMGCRFNRLVEFLISLEVYIQTRLLSLELQKKNSNFQSDYCQLPKKWIEIFYAISDKYVSPFTNCHKIVD